MWCRSVSMASITREQSADLDTAFARATTLPTLPFMCNKVLRPKPGLHTGVIRGAPRVATRPVQRIGPVEPVIRRRVIALPRLTAGAAISYPREADKGSEARRGPRAAGVPAIKARKKRHLLALPPQVRAEGRHAPTVAAGVGVIARSGGPVAKPLKERGPVAVLIRHKAARAGALSKTDIPGPVKAKPPAPRRREPIGARREAGPPDRHQEIRVAGRTERTKPRPIKERRQGLPCRAITAAAAILAAADGPPLPCGPGWPTGGRARSGAGTGLPLLGRLGAPRDGVRREIQSKADRDPRRPAAPRGAGPDPRDPRKNTVRARIGVPVKRGKGVT